MTEIPCERPFYDDVLHGAAEIADFLYGTRKKKRRIYGLVDQGGLPVFRDGQLLCARRTVLVSWIEEQEQSALKASKAA